MIGLSSFEKSPTKVYFESQEKDEQILYLLRRDWITNVPWIFFGIVIFLFPIIFNVLLNQSLFFLIPQKYVFEANILWYLMVTAFMLENYLLWFFNVYLVTDRRIMDIDFYGLFNKRVSEAPLENIEDITYSVSGVVQTVFNFGNIYIQTAAEQREFEFHFIPNPQEVHDKLTDLVTEKRGKNFRRTLKR